eukprot:GHVU01192194.1.p1 GENE.GHVU01192194.1~~GHVU01192194.1.p1  ORF type:complete len:113 (+),score=2.75 GHVU01192194.1:519-857(+)
MLEQSSDKSFRVGIIACLTGKVVYDLASESGSLLTENDFFEYHITALRSAHGEIAKRLGKASGKQRLRSPPQGTKSTKITASSNDFGITVILLPAGKGYLYHLQRRGVIEGW